MQKQIALAIVGFTALVGAHPITCFRGNTVSILLDPPKAYVPPKMTTAQRTRALALTIFGECRNCSNDGKIAVGWTIMNRVKRGQEFGDYHIENVVWRRKQYSCWNKHDPNRQLLGHIGLLKKDSPDEIAWTQSKGIALGLMDGTIGADPTHGALYYHTKHVVPWWLHDPRLKKTVTIGDHIFYRIKKSH